VAQPIETVYVGSLAESSLILGCSGSMLEIMAGMKQVKGFVQRLTREFSPQRIILFGSHARGDHSVDSDVDRRAALHDQFLTTVFAEGKTLHESSGE